MLKTRTLTAVTLLLLFVAALSAPNPWPFLLLVLALLAAAAQEWAALNPPDSAQPETPAARRWVWAGWGFAVLLAILCLVFWATFAAARSGGLWLWGWATLAWLMIMLISLRSGIESWRASRPALRWLCGFVLLFFSFAALLRLRQAGNLFLFTTLALIWVSDIAAYFFGRAFGRHKLAAAISPGKSWEGAAAALLAVLLLCVLWHVLEGRHGKSIFAATYALGGWAGLIFFSLLLAVLGILGDLFESLMKRAAGAKDSGFLLPGHGGVLDRLDALLPVLPCAAALADLATRRSLVL